MESLIYVGGQKESIQFLFDPLDSNLPKMTQVSNEQIQNQREIKKIVSGNRQNFLLWRNNNTLEFYRKGKPMKQFSIKNEIVKGIYSGYTTYLILTESGNVFSLSEKAAYHEVPLDDPENSTFDEIRPIPFFNEEENNRKVQSIAMSGWSSYYVCKDGTMYGNGFNKPFKRKESNNEIKIHKMLVELRTKLKIDQIQKVLNENNINTEELKLFLKWIYFDEINNSNALKKIFNFLNLSYPPENGLEKDLSRLFNDEDSKDFKILIKEDEEYEEEGEEDEEAFEEIPVHKIILLARSGLFREMFENLNEKEKKINQIKDYSGKSFESLELLIKYFYTDKIELTADDDPELIFEELNDSIEYYLLNKNSNFNTELNKCKTFN